MKETIVSLIALISTAVLPVSQAAGPLLSPIPEYMRVLGGEEQVLAEHSLDLTTRDKVEIVNEVFAFNILKALEFLGTDRFTLEPGEIFAFHANVLPEFAQPKITMNSQFYVEEGYRAIGGLGGNGVCHLATLMNWVATEAGLEVTALANHNFSPVLGVPREYGTSIRSQSPTQNLYLKNGFDYPVTFVFKVDGEKVTLKITR
jgi:hypothetical protein